MSDREHNTDDLLIVLDALRSEQQAGDGHRKSFLDTDSVAWLVEQVIELRRQLADLTRDHVVRHGAPVETRCANCDGTGVHIRGSGTPHSMEETCPVCRGNGTVTR